MKRLVLENEAIKKNLAVIKDRAGSAAIYAVLTGDGFGAGLLPMARLLREEGIVRYAVSEVEEAELLRKNGFEQEEILMLRSTAEHEVLERLMALNGIAEGRATVVEANIQVDTCLGLCGFLDSEPEQVLSAYRYLPNVALSGIHTQIHSGSKKEAEDQIAQLRVMLEKIHAAGFETGIVHAAGSQALLRYDFTHLDAVRVGSAILGRSGNDRRLTRVGYGEAALEELRWLPKGHTIHNDRSVTLSRATRVAPLPVGYQNGFGVRVEREAGVWAALKRWGRGRRTYVRLGAQRVPVLGKVGAFETLLDVTDVKCAAGDVATFELDPLFARGMKKEFR